MVFYNKIRLIFSVTGVVMIIFSVIYFNPNVVQNKKIQGYWRSTDNPNDIYFFDNNEYVGADGRGYYQIRNGKIEFVNTRESYELYVNRNFLYLDDIIYERY